VKRDEKYWTQVVVTMALGLGLLARWNPDSRREVGSRGFFDVVAAGPRGLLLAELKMPDGETTAEQDLWAWLLTQLSGPILIRLWTVPDDIWSGQIERDLRTLL
jgi:hypothetical protein